MMGGGPELAVYDCGCKIRCLPDGALDPADAATYLACMPRGARTARDLPFAARVLHFAETLGAPVAPQRFLDVARGVASGPSHYELRRQLAALAVERGLSRPRARANARLSEVVYPPSLRPAARDPLWAPPAGLVAAAPRGPLAAAAGPTVGSYAVFPGRLFAGPPPTARSSRALAGLAVVALDAAAPLRRRVEAVAAAAAEGPTYVCCAAAARPALLFLLGRLYRDAAPERTLDRLEYASGARATRAGDREAASALRVEEALAADANAAAAAFARSLGRVGGGEAAAPSSKGPGDAESGAGDDDDDDDVLRTAFAAAAAAQRRDRFHAGARIPIYV